MERNLECLGEESRKPAMLITPFCENQLLAGISAERCYDWCHDGGWPGRCCTDQDPICPVLSGRTQGGAQCKPCPVRTFGLNAGHFAPPDPLSRRWTARNTQMTRIPFHPPWACLGNTVSAPSTAAHCWHAHTYVSSWHTRGTSFSWRRGW